MPSLSAEKQADLIRQTKGAAEAFLEDLQYLRDISARIQTSRSEVRRLSAVLRRLVVENEIARIADPRMGRITFNAPDNKHFYDLAKRIHVMYFSSSSAHVFGTTVAASFLANLGQTGARAPEEHIRRKIGELNKLQEYRAISLRSGNFVAQRVICYAQQWVTRGAVITHVANFMSGVHSRAVVEPEELLLEKIRTACLYSIEDGNLKIHFLPELGRNSAPVIVSSSRGKLEFTAPPLDPLLVELLATAKLLVESPDVSALDTLLVAEMSE